MIVRKQYMIVAGVLLALLAGFVSSFWAQTKPQISSQKKLPFSPGEKLHYAVRWRLVPAGDAELTLEETDSGQWKATAKAASVGYVSNLYKVQDEYQSTFHGPNLCSNGIHKVINEGERHREVSLIFDQRRQLALLQDLDASGSTPPRQAQFPIPSCVHDILSALYYVRLQPLVVGQSLEFPVNDGSRTVQVRVEVQAKEEIKTPAGMFQAIRVEPNLFSGNLFKQKAHLFVWFSDDAARLPVQVKAQIGLTEGTITASLSSVEQPEDKP